MKLGIGAVFKNETHIMIEWIEHYIEHGVDHIYLINDHSTDRIDIIKEIYKNNDKVTFYDSDVDSGPYRRQIDIYNKYLNEVMKIYDWFGVIDLDEFLYSPEYFNFKDALNNIPENISQIYINWVTFGSNHHYKQPLSVVQGFNRRIEDISDPKHLSHKNLFRPKNLNILDIHTHSVSGNSENYSYINMKEQALFLLNHYVIQSQEFFKAVKAKRGDVNKIVSTDFRNMDYFNRYDCNDIEDNRLYLQNKYLIERIKDKIEYFHKNYLSF